MPPPKYRELAYQTVNTLIVTCGQYRKGSMVIVCRNMSKHQAEKMDQNWDSRDSL